jgi:hypothetical protein
MLIYLAMAVDFPQWAHKAMDKICMSYLWRGHKEAKGGYCLVAQYVAIATLKPRNFQSKKSGLVKVHLCPRVSFGGLMTNN